MNRPTVKPTAITYMLIVECARPEIGIMARYVASTPFPHFPDGSSLELLDCDPKTWDVHFSSQRISSGKDGSVVISTLVLADSPVIENRGFVVRKQSGEEIGPSATRFGRIKG